MQGKSISGLHSTYYAILKGRTRVRKGMDLSDLGTNKWGKIEG